MLMQQPARPVPATLVPLVTHAHHSLPGLLSSAIRHWDNAAAYPQQSSTRRQRRSIQKLHTWLCQAQAVVIAQDVQPVLSESIPTPAGSPQQVQPLLEHALRSLA